MIPMRLEINEKIKSIMIVVPHQDDEILMTAGVIRRAVEAGVACTVLMATNGDYGCKDFSKGYARLRESIVLRIKQNFIGRDVEKADFITGRILKKT